MCAYNRVNGAYACNNDFLLNKVLKGDWGYKRWVMSDWGAVPGLEAAEHGLDQQSGQQLDAAVYFAGPLRQAVEDKRLASARVEDMVYRILRSMFAVGLFDDPPAKQPIDFEADGAVAQKAAEAGIVLLKNEGGTLPLSKSIGRVAVIGGHADLGVLSGGGSSQVLPPGGTAIRIPSNRGGEVPSFASRIFHPSPPLAAIRAIAPSAKVDYYGGAYPSAAARLASKADAAIVFATQWMTEGADAPDLSLPDGQDALIAAVAAANHGLSYTQFAFSKLTVTGGATLRATFDVTNTGSRPGAETAQLYLLRAGGERLERLFGFKKVELGPGETRTLTLTADLRVLADFDAKARNWQIAAGTYEVGVGPDAQDLVQTGSAQLNGARF